MKHLSIAALAITALSPWAAWAENLDVTRSIAADGTVSVGNISGSIAITAWDRNEVHLGGFTGTNQELIVTETDRGVSFEVQHIDDDEDFDESELVLKVPAGAVIVANGVSADITIRGSRAPSISAETVSGDIEVEAEAGRVDMSVVSGDLSFEGSTGRLTAESVAGDIEVSGAYGELNVQTVSGDAKVDAGEVAIGQFETVSGTLNLSMSVSDGGKLVVASMSGDVELFLPASQGGSFNAQTFSGDISSDFGNVVEEDFGPGSHLEHVSGSSGTEIRVESFNGDIRIGRK